MVFETSSFKLGQQLEMKEAREISNCEANVYYAQCFFRIVLLAIALTNTEKIQGTTNWSGISVEISYGQIST